MCIRDRAKSKTFDLEMEEKMIRIAVLGYGTVGSGVVKVIQTNAKIIAKRAGQEVEVKYVLDLSLIHIFWMRSKEKVFIS